MDTGKPRSQLSTVNSQLPSGDILLAYDGEPHSEGAVRWALALAGATGRRVVALFVKDPYLKQFHNEIYAQGRQEYLDHVDRCNEELAAAAQTHQERAAAGTEVTWEHRVRDGDPAEEVTAEVEAGGYALVVAGAGRAPGRWSRKPQGLGRRLAAALEVPVLVVPSSE